jgi:hypothetical protein
MSDWHIGLSLSDRLLGDRDLPESAIDIERIARKSNGGLLTFGYRS